MYSVHDTRKYSDNNNNNNNNSNDNNNEDDNVSYRAPRKRTKQNKNVTRRKQNVYEDVDQVEGMINQPEGEQTDYHNPFFEND